MAIYDIPGNDRRGSAPYVNPTPPRATDGRFQSGPIGFEWQGLRAAQDNLFQVIDDIDTKRVEGAQRLVNDMVQYAKANAPWKDRSGDARDTIQGQVIDHAEEHYTEVFLGMSIFYAGFLEYGTQHAKSYAIIGPTLDYYMGQLQDYIS